jgi:probable rRNA maturation factor
MSGSAEGPTTRIAVDVSTDGVRLPLSRARVAEIVRAVLRAERVRSALISVAFVSRRAIAALNRRHRGHTGATDVIAFAFDPGASPHAVIGDIYIAPDVARENAQLHGRGVREEIARLAIHGTLHVLGHDHPTDAGRTSSPMWRRQERLLARVVGGKAT